MGRDKGCPCDQYPEDTGMTFPSNAEDLYVSQQWAPVNQQVL